MLSTIVRNLGLVILAFVTTACEGGSWRQKMTVVVETPQGDVVTTGVTQSITSHDRFIPGSPGGRYQFGWSGEAIPIALPNGRHLFVLLEDALAGEATANYLAPYAGSHPKPRRLTDMVNTIRASTEIAPIFRDSEYILPTGFRPWDVWLIFPRLVTFRDLKDPLSIELVEPTDLRASFGPGHRLKLVMLEVTSERVTTGRVDSLLPWLSDLNGRIEFDQFGNPSITTGGVIRTPNPVTPSDFKRR
jgi:hypothetical protein